VPIPELHAEPALHYEEQFVLVIVVVPDEWPLELDEFHLLALQLTDDLRFSADDALRSFEATVIEIEGGDTITVLLDKTQHKSGPIVSTFNRCTRCNTRSGGLQVAGWLPHPASFFHCGDKSIGNPGQRNRPIVNQPRAYEWWYDPSVPPTDRQLQPPFRDPQFKREILE
jgi:hypothetical protein